MRHAFRRLSIIILFLSIPVAFIGCAGLDTTTSAFATSATTTGGDAAVAIAIDRGEVPDELSLDDFDLSDLTVVVTMRSGASFRIPVAASMIDAADLAKLGTAGTHTITIRYQEFSAQFTVTLLEPTGLAVQLAVIYGLGVESGTIEGTYEEWLDSIRGEDGVGIAAVAIDGLGHLIVTLTDDSVIDAGLVLGAAVELRVSAGYVQWKPTTAAVWTNLLPLSDLVGPAGSSPVVTIDDDGYWVVDGVRTEYRATYGEPETLSVAFDPVGGAMPAGVLTVWDGIESGSYLDLPVPTREGYLFRGWFTGDTVNDGQFTNANAVTRSIALVARWELDLSILEAFFDLEEYPDYTLVDTFERFESEGGVPTRTVSERTCGFTWAEDALTARIVARVDRYRDGVLVGSDQVADYTILHDEDGSFWYGFYAPWTDAYFGADDQGLPRETIDLSMFAATEFAKRHDANLYDFIGPESDLRALAEWQSRKDQYLDWTATAYYDADARSFCVDSVWTGTDADPDVKLEERRCVALRAVGTTRTAFSFDALRAAMRLHLENLHVGDWGYEMASAESLADYAQAVDWVMSSIAGIDEPLQLLLSYQIAAGNYILWFEFEPDPAKILASARAESLSQLAAQLALFARFATDASVAAMTAIHDAAVAALAVAATPDECWEIVQDAVAEFDAAFVEDPEKRSLWDAQSEAIDRLRWVIGYLANWCLAADESSLASFLEEREALIRAAADIPAVATALADARSALASLDVTYSSALFASGRIDMRIDFVLLYDEAASALSDFYGYPSDHLSVQRSDAFLALDAALDPVDFLFTLDDAKRLLSETMLSIIRVEEPPRLDEIKAEALAIVHDAYVDEVVERHALYADWIATGNDWREMAGLFLDYRQECWMLPFDELKMRILDASELLRDVVADYALTATSESIEAMLAVCDAWIVEFGTAANVDAVDDLLILAEVAVGDAYVADPDKVALADALATAAADIDLMLEILALTAVDDAVFLGFHETAMAARSALYSVTIPADAFALVGDIVLLFESSAFSVRPDAAFELFVFVHLEPELIVAMASMDAASAYALEIQAASIPTVFTTPKACRDYVLAYRETISSAILEGYRGATVAAVDRMADELAEMIPDASLEELSILRDDIVAAILAAPDAAAIDAAWDVFREYWNAAIYDDYKKLRNEYVAEGRSILEDLSAIATDEAIAAMTARYATYEAAVRATSSETVMENELAALGPALYALVAEDPVRAACREAADRAVLALELYRDIASLSDSWELSTERIDIAIDRALWRIGEAVTAEAVETARDEAFAAMLAVDLDLGYGDMPYVRGLAIDYVLELATLVQAMGYDQEYVLVFESSLIDELDAILNQYNLTPQDVYLLAVDYRETRWDEIYADHRDATLASLTAIYAAKINVVDFTLKTALQTAYANAYGAAEAYRFWTSAAPIVDAFQTYADSLPNDTLGPVREEARDDLFAHFDTLTVTATDASVLAMMDVVSYWMDEIMAAATQAEIDAAFDDGVAALHAVYVAK